MIFVNGERVDNMPEDDLMKVRADLGMVFQEGALFDSLTVRENVGYKLFEETNAPLDDVNRRVEEVLGFVGSSEFIDRMPSELSGGQRRRVAIARAMTAKPRILLYDEPTTGLDPITSLTIDEEIIKLRDLEGVSSIVVTHQLRDAFFVAEHMARARTGGAPVRARRRAEGRRGGVHHVEGRPDCLRGERHGAARRRPRKTATSTRFSREGRYADMPRTRSLAWSELKIGIVAVVALVLAVMLIFAVGGQGGFSWQRYELKTKFPNVQGLKVGAIVRVAGVDVGQGHGGGIRRRRRAGRRWRSNKENRGAHHRPIARVDRIAQPARRADHRNQPVAAGHAAQGRRLHPERADTGADRAMSRRMRPQTLEQATGADQGDPQRQRERSANCSPTIRCTAS